MKHLDRILAIVLIALGSVHNFVAAPMTYPELTAGAPQTRLAMPCLAHTFFYIGTTEILTNSIIDDLFQTFLSGVARGY